MKRDSYSDQQAHASFQPQSSQPAIEPTQLGQPVHHSSSTSDLGAKWLSKASGWMADKLQTAQNFVNGSGDAILQGRGYANAPDQILPALKGTVKPALSQAGRTNQPLVGVIDAGFGTDEHGGKMVAAIQKENPQAKIWQGGGVGTGGGLESLTEFVDVAKATGQRAVANLSFDLTEVHPDGSSSTRAQLTAKEQSALSYARDNGVLVVASSGNQGGAMSALGQASQPSDNLIVVGAAKGSDRASYSSYGNGLDLVVEVGSAGTSLAAAKVTGAIAKLWSANPGLNSQQVEQMLTTTATDLKTPGWDAETGAGLLNSGAAIALATHTAPEAIVFSGAQLMQQVPGSFVTWESRDGAVATERTNRFIEGDSPRSPAQPASAQRAVELHRQGERDFMNRPRPAKPAPKAEPPNQSRLAKPAPKAEPPNQSRLNALARKDKASNVAPAKPAPTVAPQSQANLNALIRKDKAFNTGGGEPTPRPIPTPHPTPTPAPTPPKVHTSGHRSAPTPTPTPTPAPTPMRVPDTNGSSWDWGEIVHATLDVAGFVPGFGAVADIANAGLYAVEGDYANAALSAAAAVPGIGDAAAAVKLAGRGVEAAQAANRGAEVAQAANRRTRATQDATAAAVPSPLSPGRAPAPAARLTAPSPASSSGLRRPGSDRPAATSEQVRPTSQRLVAPSSASKTGTARRPQEQQSVAVSSGRPSVKPQERKPSLETGSRPASSQQLDHQPGLGAVRKPQPKPPESNPGSSPWSPPPRKTPDPTPYIHTTGDRKYALDPVILSRLGEIRQGESLSKFAERIKTRIWDNNGLPAGNGGDSGNSGSPPTPPLSPNQPSSNGGSDGLESLVEHALQEGQKIPDVASDGNIHPSADQIAEAIRSAQRTRSRLNYDPRRTSAATENGLVERNGYVDNPSLGQHLVDHRDDATFKTSGRDNGVPGSASATHAEPKVVQQDIQANPDSAITAFAVDRPVCRSQAKNPNGSSGWCVDYLSLTATKEGRTIVVAEPGGVWVFHPDIPANFFEGR